MIIFKNELGISFHKSIKYLKDLNSAKLSDFDQ